MQNGIIYSTVLHAAIVLLAIVGLPFLSPPPSPLQQAISVEIVTIAEKTQAPKPRPKAPPEKKPAPTPPKPEPIKRPPTPKPPPAPPETAALPPAPEPEAVPLPKSEPKAKSKAKVKPKPKPKPKTKKAAKPVTKAKPKDKPKRERQEDDMLAALRTVEEIERRAPPSEAKPDKPDKKPPPIAPFGDRLTISELDALRQQLYRCWNVPLGARGAQDMVVGIRVTVHPDRTVARAEILDRSRMMSDPYYRAMAESAYRAVKNERCSPLRLPPDKYELWKTLTLNFDPREMVR